MLSFLWASYAGSFSASKQMLTQSQTFESIIHLSRARCIPQGGEYNISWLKKMPYQHTMTNCTWIIWNFSKPTSTLRSKSIIPDQGPQISPQKSASHLRISLPREHDIFFWECFIWNVLFILSYMVLGYICLLKCDINWTKFIWWCPYSSLSI